ncbi:MAG: HAMP domain-containing protein [Thermoguttaceae bacterium]|nr:HAMP domain-containing protein [Thermoguttaceae bacterium]
MELRRSGRPFLESSLEIKCLFFFGVALGAVILISVFLYYKASKSQVDAQNPLMGKLVSEREFLLTHIKGLTAESATARSRDMGDLNKFIDSMTTLSEKIGGLSERARFETRLISLRNRETSIVEDTSLDLFERRLIERLNANAEEGHTGKINFDSAVERVDDEGRYHYYKPLLLDRPCWNCHHEVMEDSSLELGSPLGVIQVTIPEPPTRKESARLWTLLIGGAIIAAFLGLFAFYVVVRVVVVRPLRNLREVSEAISRGDVSKRAELQTGDEFEALGASFNKMLRYLVDTQERLESLNSQLEKKVDELAQTNLELYKSNKIKSDFMATMSHELRTPLNSILGFSQMLGSIQSLTDKQRKYVNNINTSGTALLRMINNILDMTKIEDGRVEVRLSEFKIETVVLAQCDMARPLVDKKNLELTTQFTPDLPTLMQDESRIQQIINNLLSNAIKFTPEGGRIQVSVDREMRFPVVKSIAAHENESIPFLRLQVRDSGVGVPEEERQIIFEKFRQGKNSADGSAMTREYSGSGLGLSIVRELCKLLEGEIQLESQPGFGSTFTVYLPWRLNLPTLTESPMQTEIHEFSRAGSTRLNSVRTQTLNNQ